MNPEQLEAVAAQAYVEMLEGGFGRVGEFHYLHHDAEWRSVLGRRRDVGADRRRRARRVASGSRCCRFFTLIRRSAGRPRHRPSGDSSIRWKAMNAAAALSESDASRLHHGRRRRCSSQSARGDARRTDRPSRGSRVQAPVHIHIAEQVQGSGGVRGLVRASGRSNGCSAHAPVAAELVPRSCDACDAARSAGHR